MKALFVAGEVSQFLPTSAYPKRISSSVQALISTHIDGEVIPPTVQACAFACLGKICLQVCPGIQEWR